MAKQMTANLEAGLGEHGTDSVYLRTYSVLVLMEIVAFDNAHPFLDQADLDGFLEAALGYLLRERDLRSWVPGPGWANAIGHSADLLMMLARSPHLGATELQRILDVIADRLLTPSPVVFVHHEDERLAYATLNVLRRNLVDRSWLVAWLDRFTAAPGQDSWRSAYASEAESAARANVTAFLRSLYFQLILTESPPDAQRTPTPSWSRSDAPTSASTTWPERAGPRWPPPSRPGRRRRAGARRRGPGEAVRVAPGALGAAQPPAGRPGGRRARAAGRRPGGPGARRARPTSRATSATATNPTTAYRPPSCSRRAAGEPGPW